MWRLGTNRAAKQTPSAMSIVIPTILTTTKQDVLEKLKRVEGLVDTVQIDVVDGRFAGPPTWPYTESGGVLPPGRDGWLREYGDFRYEIDLMVENPEETAGYWIAAGATRIVIHIESTHYLPRLMDELSEKYGYAKGFTPTLLSFGLSLSIATDTNALTPFLDRVDYIQFMGIKIIGKQGQPFDERVLSKLRSFHKAHPEVVTQIDGGVTLTSAPALLSTGIDHLVVGHDLWEASDISGRIAQYERLSEEHGRYA